MKSKYLSVIGGILLAYALTGMQYKLDDISANAVRYIFIIGLMIFIPSMIHYARHNK